MKHLKLFEEFISESKADEIDYKKSPFRKFPELCVTKKTGTKMPGELNRVGEVVHVIYENPGFSEKELANFLLGYPLNTPQKEVYHRGGHQITNLLSKVLSTKLAKRTSARPARYYAYPDPNLTIDELVDKFSGTVQGRNYGI